jgi:structural hemagglutinin/hemolysin toxin protein RtxA
MYLISFYVPETHVEKVKNALFLAGAGSLGNYSHCAWQVLGEGQYLPLSGSNAFSGEVNILEIAPEYKVELVCTKEKIKNAIAALIEAHPYEVPAYQVISMQQYHDLEDIK